MVEKHIDYVAIYAALVATAALLWNVIQAYVGRKKSVRIRVDPLVELAPSYLTVLDSDRRDEPLRIPKLRVTITNTGGVALFVEQPRLVASSSIIGINEWGYATYTNELSFPREMVAGETISISIDPRAILNFHLNQLADNETICVAVKETVGKDFRSNVVTLGEVRATVRATESA